MGMTCCALVDGLGSTRAHLSLTAALSGLNTTGPHSTL